MCLLGNASVYDNHLSSPGEEDAIPCSEETAAGLISSPGPGTYARTPRLALMGFDSLFYIGIG